MFINSVRSASRVIHWNTAKRRVNAGFDDRGGHHGNALSVTRANVHHKYGQLQVRPGNREIHRVTRETFGAMTRVTRLRKEQNGVTLTMEMISWHGDYILKMWITHLVDVVLNFMDRPQHGCREVVFKRLCPSPNGESLPNEALVVGTYRRLPTCVETAPVGRLALIVWSRGRAGGGEGGSWAALECEEV